MGENAYSCPLNFLSSSLELQVCGDFSHLGGGRSGSWLLQRTGSTKLYLLRLLGRIKLRVELSPPTVITGIGLPRHLVNRCFVDAGEEQPGRFLVALQAG